ncbi:hypothetical protein LPB19_00460 [Marinobacter salinisoli]|uniref:DUF4864 domain-containing protein n=1 Tax=Marinobacter salinisoli TaxID=2769486 RepID=A0ABX7MU80_9GAMM|nr:hypothetical protein [Marinobacter salinisoli]QSP94934.1 hypothetical protein LPB19_00460 [Marinobacter salinisoli]
MRPNLPLICLLCLLVAGPANAEQELPGRDDIRQQTGAFMDMVASGRILPAYQSLRPYLGVSADAYDQSGKEAAAYFQKVRNTAGDPVGASRVKAEVIADDFTRETWLQKFETAAIAWRFTFYQPAGSGWRLVGVSYSTDLEELYQTVD